MILVTWPTVTGWGTTSKAGSRSRTTRCPRPPGWTPEAGWSSLRGSSGPSRVRCSGPSSTSSPTTWSPSPPTGTFGSLPLIREEWLGAQIITHCTMLMGLQSMIRFKKNFFNHSILPGQFTSAATATPSATCPTARSWWVSGKLMRMLSPGAWPLTQVTTCGSPCPMSGTARQWSRSTQRLRL